MRLSKWLILLTVLLLTVPAMAGKGAGIQFDFDVNTATLKNGVVFYLSAFDSHVRAFGNGNYGEDLNSADKQWDAGLDFLYVPSPTQKVGFYMELGGDAEWLDTQYGIEDYWRGLVGLGGVYHFGTDDAGYFGYRMKSVGVDGANHEIVLRLIFGL